MTAAAALPTPPIAPLWRAKLNAALVHASLSVTVAALVALLVFGLWFPSPYRELSGGRELFWLVMGVDIVCGPLLTAVIYNPRKRRAELVRDLGFVVLIQLAALAYGLHAVMQARPVVVVFEADRLRVLSIADIDTTKLKDAAPDLRELSLTGPRLIAARVPRPNDSDFNATLDLALQGVEVSMLPAYWRPYDEYRKLVSLKAQPISELKRKQPAAVSTIDEAVAKTGMRPEQIGWLPMQSRRSSDWVALLRRDTADVVGFVPVEGF
jgi:hypothetical protein